MGAELASVIMALIVAWFSNGIFLNRAIMSASSLYSAIVGSCCCSGDERNMGDRLKTFC